MRIVIAGAGLVGLTTAATLRRSGHEVLVIEQAAEVRAVGAGIGLWENALRTLDTLHLRPAVEAISSTVDTWFYTVEGDPRRSPGTADADYQFLLVPRPELSALLADAVGRERIHTAVRVAAFSEHADGVTVALSDGEQLQCELLIGADGVYSAVRRQLLPGTDAHLHGSHTAWRAVVPAGPGERPGGTSLTIGKDGTRGGYTRLDGGRTMWMVNQFESGPLTGDKRRDALDRAHNLVSDTWHQELLAMIERTPQESILENRITLVPPLATWSSARVTLIGDAAHGLSPHLSAGGTLGIEDVAVLDRTLNAHGDLSTALSRYQEARIPRFTVVRQFADDIQRAENASQFADAYARFSHWMVTTAP